MLRPAVIALFIALFLALLAWPMPAGAGEYDFDIPEAQKKPWELGGRLELRYGQHWLNDSSARYRLNYFRDDPGEVTHEWRPQVEFKGSYRWGMAQVHLLTHHEYQETYQGGEALNRVYEGYLSLKPSANLTLEAGKKSLLWGKGYAWNPAGFVNRIKDPDDPELNLEGFTAVGGDYIKSFTSGSLQNLAVTALALPVLGDWENTELGRSGDINYALKLYLLWYDTDLDFIYFNGPDQPEGFGFDFAKNLAENFEVHGEIGLRREVNRVLLDATGNAAASREDQWSYLLGLRYLTASDTTVIAEYYHNGAGYGPGELDDFFAYQQRAWDQWLATGNDAIMQRADQATRPYYRQRTFGQDYLYLKVTQKEPLDILYFTPWLAAIISLTDGSFNLQPGATYAPITNLELNLRVGIPLGSSGTEFGEKPDTVRPEFWVRYYF